MCCLLCVQLLEEATKRNGEWEAQFLRQGQTLVADSAAPSLSLEAELENVSKDEVNTHTPVTKRNSYYSWVVEWSIWVERVLVMSLAGRPPTLKYYQKWLL